MFSPGGARVCTQVKKKPFIDKAEAAHFHLVHRSQRDPKSADPEASARVLTPAAVSGNLKKGSSQLGSVSSSRAWAAEQAAHPHEASARRHASR